MLKTLAERIYRFSTTGPCSLCLFLFAYTCVVLERPAVGICALALYLCLLCLCHGDVLPLVLPLLLIYCLTFYCPSSVWLAYLGIPCGLALSWRLWCNRHAMRPGKSFFGMIAVSIALVLGGVGSISAEEYFSPGAIYILLALGPMMIGIYLLQKSSLSQPRHYDIGEYISTVMYATAVFVAFLILRIFLTHPEILIEQDHVVHKLEALAGWRNGASNLAVILLPFIFYYARRHGFWHLFSALAVYVIVALAGARAAIVIGALALLLGFAYFTHRRPWLRLAIVCACLACCAVAFVYREPLITFAEDFLCINISGAQVEDESRYKLMMRAIEDFLHNPFSGRGLGYTGNNDIYPLDPTANPDDVRFRVHWYHSLLPQIIGSMGIVGILAYGYQFLLRLRVMLHVRRTAYTGALILSYVVTLLYSQIDPGIFSPMPFGLLVVLTFALLEAEPAHQKNA